jgi:hypothetical protein
MVCSETVTLRIIQITTRDSRHSRVGEELRATAKRHKCQGDTTIIDTNYSVLQAQIIQSLSRNLCTVYEFTSLAQEIYRYASLNDGDTF